MSDDVIVTTFCGMPPPPVAEDTELSLNIHACARELGHEGNHKCKFTLARKTAVCCDWPQEQQGGGGR
jgi:hypothetical protein